MSADINTTARQRWIAMQSRFWLPRLLFAFCAAVFWHWTLRRSHPLSPVYTHASLRKAVHWQYVRLFLRGNR